MAAPRSRRQSAASMRDLAVLDLAGHPLAARFPEAVALGFRACDPADGMMPGRLYLNDSGMLRRFEAGGSWQGVARVEARVHAE